MRAVIHIGLPKSGSKTFQANLYDMRNELKKFDVGVTDGIMLNDGRGASSVALANLILRESLDTNFRKINPELLLPSYKSKLKEEIERNINSHFETIIFSHESLSFVRTKDELLTLKSLMGNRRVEIVFVYREEKSFLESYTKQVESDNFGILPDLPIDSCRYCGKDSWILDFENLISLYSTVFGSKSLKIVNFSLSHKHYKSETYEASNLIHRLWNACDLPHELLKDLPNTILNSTKYKKRPSEVKYMLTHNFKGYNIFMVKQSTYFAVPQSAGEINQDNIKIKGFFSSNNLDDIYNYINGVD